MKSAGIGAGLVAAVVVLIWLGTGFFIVQEGQQAVITQFGRYKATVGAGFNWRLPYPIQRHETGVRHADPLGRRRPRHRDQGHRPARIGHADRGREHRRDQVRGAVPPERRARLPVREQEPVRGRGAGGRDRGARGGRQDAHGLGAGRGARPDRAARAHADADHPRPLQGRRRGRRHQPAAGRRAAARAGAGGLRRRAQGRPGARARQERGPGLCQRRDPARRGRGVAPEAGGRGLQGARSWRRRRAMRSASSRCWPNTRGAAGHARPHVPRHHAADLQQRHQGPGRLAPGLQPAVPAARQDHAAGGARRRGTPSMPRAPTSPAPPRRNRRRSRSPVRGDARARDNRAAASATSR